MTTTNNKNKELLDELMALTIEEILTIIKSGEANPAILNVARQLLKDNQLSASVTEDNSMISIVEHLPFREADEQKTATNS
jgi:hypothetical protein